LHSPRLDCSSQKLGWYCCCLIYNLAFVAAEFAVAAISLEELSFESLSQLQGIIVVHT